MAIRTLSDTAAERMTIHFFVNFEVKKTNLINAKLGDFANLGALSDYVDQ